MGIRELPGICWYSAKSVVFLYHETRWHRGFVYIATRPWQIYFAGTGLFVVWKGGLLTRLAGMGEVVVWLAGYVAK